MKYFISIKEFRWKIALAVVFVVFMLLNVYVLREDMVTPQYDSVKFVETALDLSDQVLRGQFPVPPGPFLNPPLFEYMMMITGLIFDTSADTLVHTNVVFTFLLIVGVYGVVRRFSSEAIAFLTVFICMSMPAVFGTSRILWHEYPLMCTIVFSYFMLFKTEYFTRLKYVFMWAITIGCALLIKSSVILYIIIPVILYCIRAVYVSKEKLSIMRRLVICILLALVLAGWWYALNFMYIVDAYKGVLEIHEQYLNTSLMCLLRAHENICNQSVYAPFYLIFLISFPLLFIRSTYEKALIGMGIFIPILIHAFSEQRLGFNSNRYFMPLLPLIAISIANLMEKIRQLKAGRVAYGAMAALCVLQVAVVHAGYGALLQFDDKVLAEQDDLYSIIEKGKVVPRKILVDPAHILDVMHEIKREPEITVLLALHHQQIESYFTLEEARGTYPLKVCSKVMAAFEHHVRDTKIDDPSLLDLTEFIIVLGDKVIETGDTPPFFAVEWIPNIMAEFEKRKNRYKKIMVKTDNSGFEIILYQKIEQSAEI